MKFSKNLSFFTSPGFIVSLIVTLLAIGLIWLCKKAEETKIEQLKAKTEIICGDRLYTNFKIVGNKVILPDRYVYSIGNCE